MRGKQLLQTALTATRRYNPACAGKTCGIFRAPCHPQIQPRVCGENTIFFSTLIVQRDTTPRVRGKPTDAQATRSGRRYNPACAGKTLMFFDFLKVGSIQPRVCGENIILGVRTSFLTDTTPRVRGKLQLLFPFAFSFRYNPACAGKTVDTIYH